MLLVPWAQFCTYLAGCKYETNASECNISFLNDGKVCCHWEFGGAIEILWRVKCNVIIARCTLLCTTLGPILAMYKVQVLIDL